MQPLAEGNTIAFDFDCCFQYSLLDSTTSFPGCVTGWNLFEARCGLPLSGVQRLVQARAWPVCEAPVRGAHLKGRTGDGERFWSVQIAMFVEQLWSNSNEQANSNGQYYMSWILCDSFTCEHRSIEVLVAIPLLSRDSVQSATKTIKNIDNKATRGSWPYN